MLLFFKFYSLVELINLHMKVNEYGRLLEIMYMSKAHAQKDGFRKG